MLWLPRLVAGARSWRLPLSSSAAVEIFESVLDNDPAASHARLATALQSDPAFTLWSVCRWHEPVIRAGFAPLAHWLVEGHAHIFSGLELLAAPLPGKAAPDELADQQADETSTDWLHLRLTSIEVSERAGQLAEQYGTAVAADRARLLGLLAGAVDWLSVCGPPVALADAMAGRTCLPTWLVRILAAIHDVPVDQQQDVAVRAVRMAVTECRDGDASLGRPPAARGSLHPAPGDDDHDLIAGLLPALIARLTRLEKLESKFSHELETAKLQAMREFAYGASHEINNPLANISSRAQTLLVGESDPERRKKLATINAQAFRAFEMIADAMLFAKPPQLELARLDLVHVLDRAIDEVSETALDQGTELRRSYRADAVSLVADAEQLTVALRALLRNALEAVATGGFVEVGVRTTATEVGDAGGVAIAVTDSGPGVAAEFRPRMFDPFFSGRESGRGLGFGLSKCWCIVTLHGGRIDLEDPPAGGARFVVRLPWVATAPPAVAAG